VSAMLRAELSTLGTRNREDYLAQISSIFTIVGEVTGQQEFFAELREIWEQLADVLFPPEEPTGF